MVVNKIKNKVLKPIVYKLAKDKEESPSEEDDKKEINEEELAHIREAVLKEIKEPSVEKKEKEEPLTKKILKKELVFKKKPELPKIKIRFNIKKIVYFSGKAIGLVLIFLFILTTIGIYLADWQGGLTQVITKIIPYPAVYVDGKIVTINEFLNDVGALENYLQRNGLKFTSEEVRNQVMESLIEKEIIQQLAEENNIIISDEEIEGELQRSTLQLTPREQLNQIVTELYGWDFTTYVDKVIKPLILTKRVEDYFDQASGNLAIKQEMEDYYNQFTEAPEDFDKIASEVNEDRTKAVAGDLGWLKLSDFNLNIQLVLLNLEENEISRVVDTNFGYYIIKLNERVINNVDNQLYFQVSHIFKKKSSFQEFLDEEIKRAKVVTLIKI